MRYLLDTHVVLWYFEDSTRLSQKVEVLIDNPSNGIFVSAASLWEVSIKISLGKLELSFDDMLSEIENAGFIVLQTEGEYLRVLLDLPWIHKDPFDRLLVATATCESMTLLTNDGNMQKYNVPWIW